jgi:isopentenyl-diphosphate Delta-isomerase
MPGLIDVLSPSGLRTGQALTRAEIHRLGHPHRAFHLYLFNSHKGILLQRRSHSVDHGPGYLTISVLGHLDAGEFSAAAVRREIEEELGLPAADLPIDFLFSYYQEAVLNDTYIDKQFNDVYVTHADVPATSLQFNRAEVSEVMFVPLHRFSQMVDDPTSGLAPVYAREFRDVLYFLNW